MGKITKTLVAFSAISIENSGVDLEIRHSNTEESVLFYKREQCIYIGNFSVLLDPRMKLFIVKKEPLSGYILYVKAYG